MDKTGGEQLRCQLVDYLQNEVADMSVDVYSEPRGDQLSLLFLSSSHFVAEEQLQVLLSRLCDTLIRFSANPEGVWGDCQRRKVEGGNN